VDAEAAMQEIMAIMKCARSYLLRSIFHIHPPCVRVCPQV
jgi:hypothetical protein